MIAIIDYGMGNLKSVWNALDSVAIKGVIVSDPAELAHYDRAILPGVGAFAKAMDNLNSTGFTEAIKVFVAQEKPFMGICLGMQLLAEKGFEFGERDGLGLIDGSVKIFDLPREYLVPHVGWNDIVHKRSHPCLQGVKKAVDFYFVHSFIVDTENDNVIAECDYGRPFPAIVGKGSVIGCQFHPEKSQAAGLDILENFSQWDGKC